MKKTKSKPDIKTNEKVKSKTKVDTKTKSKSKIYLAFVDGIVQTNCFVFIIFLITAEITESIKLDVNFIFSALVTVFSIFIFYLGARNQKRKIDVVLFLLYSLVTFVATLAIIFAVYMAFPFGSLAEMDFADSEGAFVVMVCACFLATSIIFKFVIAVALWLTRKK